MNPFVENLNRARKGLTWVSLAREIFTPKEFVSGYRWLKRIARHGCAPTRQGMSAHASLVKLHELLGLPWPQLWEPSESWPSAPKQFAAKLRREQPRLYDYLLNNARLVYSSRKKREPSEEENEQALEDKIADEIARYGNANHAFLGFDHDHRTPKRIPYYALRPPATRTDQT